MSNTFYVCFLLFYLVDSAFLLEKGVQDNVTFYLVNKDVKRTKLIIPDDLEKIQNSNLVKFIVHGWTESAEKPYFQQITNAYLSKGDYNIIQVDWSPISQLDYIDAYSSLTEIAEYIGTVILLLNDLHKIPLNHVHIIGHSLGGQIAGYVGKYIIRESGSKVGRISALDPAGPGFEINFFRDESRLVATDAHFVDVLHTDGGMFGYGASCGTADFYPNGGRAPQPGCSNLPVSLASMLILLLSGSQTSTSDMFCSHVRSTELFVESITSKAFVAKKCEFSFEYDAGLCARGPKISYGDDMPLTISGDFYFKTGSKSPYAEG